MINVRAEKVGADVFGNLSSPSSWDTSISSFLMPALLPLMMQTVRQQMKGGEAVEGRVDPGSLSAMAAGQKEAKPWWVAESIPVAEGDWWRESVTLEVAQIQSGMESIEQTVRKLVLRSLHVAAGKAGA